MSGHDTEPDSPAAKRRRMFSVLFAGPMDALHIIREVDPDKAGAVLERLAEGYDSGGPQILEGFQEAPSLPDHQLFLHRHRTFMRALEVYSRTSGRAPAALPAGPLRPIVTPFVGLMLNAIGTAHQRRVLKSIRELYVLREANSVFATPNYRALTLARRQVDNILPSFSSRHLSMPAFLIAGAVVSTIASLAQHLMHVGAGRVALLTVILLLTVGAFWCILMAAAVARRRTHLVLDLPLRELWDAVGSAGEPPRESSRGFVLVATLLLILGWILVPITVTIFYSLR